MSLVAEKTIEKRAEELGLYRIGVEEKLYWLNCGGGYTANGFIYLNDQAKKVAKWLKEDAPTAQLGTVEHFVECKEIMQRGQAHHNLTKKRCNADLIKKLIGRLGKSTGWMPVHLLVGKDGFSEVIRKDAKVVIYGE